MKRLLLSLTLGVLLAGCAARIEVKTIHETPRGLTPAVTCRGPEVLYY